MTIRQYIKRWVRWSLVAFIVLACAIAFLPHRVPSKIAAVIGGVATVVGLGAYLAVILLRCPRCSANIGMTIAVPTAVHMFGRRIKFCPYCATSLDEPLQRGSLERRQATQD